MGGRWWEVGGGRECGWWREGERAQVGGKLFVMEGTTALGVGGQWSVVVEVVWAGVGRDVVGTLPLSPAATLRARFRTYATLLAFLRNDGVALMPTAEAVCERGAENGRARGTPWGARGEQARFSLIKIKVHEDGEHWRLVAVFGLHAVRADQGLRLGLQPVGHLC